MSSNSNRQCMVWVVLVSLVAVAAVVKDTSSLMMNLMDT